MPVWPTFLADPSGSDRIPGADLHVPPWAWAATIGAIVAMVAAVGAFLVIAAWRIAFHDESEIDPEHNPIFRLARGIVPVSSRWVDMHTFLSLAVILALKLEESP